MPTHSPRTTVRLLTFNLLLGGSGREDRIAAVLERADADVIALQEANHLALVRRLADRLGMRMALAKPADSTHLNLAVLTRLPLTRWRARRHPGRMLRAHLECEVSTGGREVPRLRVHCVHLAARFGERANGEARRIRELRAILGDVERAPQAPHVLLGDFNAVSPGDHVAALHFFERMAELRRRGLVVRGLDGLVGAPPRSGDLDPVAASAWREAGVGAHLDVGVPRLPWVVGPLTGMLPRLPVTDRVLNSRIRRWTAVQLAEAGYLDCYRALHDDDGYTCATWCPAARIDYVFADDHMAPRLRSCDVVGGPRLADDEVRGASDHFPVVAEFAV